jgi:hypothetical protein
MYATDIERPKRQSNIGSHAREAQPFLAIVAGSTDHGWTIHILCIVLGEKDRRNVAFKDTS